MTQNRHFHCESFSTAAFFSEENISRMYLLSVEKDKLLVKSSEAAADIGTY